MNAFFYDDSDGGVGDVIVSDPPVISTTVDPWFWLFYKILSAASAGVSAYHGYKRNDGSVGWAIVWGVLGGAFPIITPAIAVAEGFGEPK